ncbi:GbsR/MarR family transcriptional regulator [Shouchella shacheensis]|uniref:GbsR/MarR family transcriptional regulator n=1 Tax=Shouchella shacheensis TaxID=1649580 RepID=UPI00073FB252|nr:hypothetical protein [Shouchella shacheensis]
MSQDAKHVQYNCKQLQEIRETFIHELSTNLHLYGITESVGRLYGTLLFEEEPLTLDEMSERLSMSKTSMSTGIRTLVEARMAKKVWQKGVRKDLYEGEDDWYQSFIAIFTRQWRASLESNTRALEEMRGDLLQLSRTREHESAFIEEIEVDLAKLDHAENYYVWLEHFIEFLESDKIFDVIPKR